MGDIGVVVRQALARAREMSVVGHTRFTELLPRHRRSGETGQVSVTRPDGDRCSTNSVRATCIQASGSQGTGALPSNHLLSW